jgi:hypothetical protein
MGVLRPMRHRGLWHVGNGRGQRSDAWWLATPQLAQIASLGAAPRPNQDGAERRREEWQRFGKNAFSDQSAYTRT